MAMILAIRRHQDCSLDNVPERSNFHDYVVLRIDQMPRVEVHIVNSAQPPTGVGEPATPVIAPAVANALFSVPDSALTVCR
jgi:isoquinoline 1-oxidoreductase beta subunit